jgi:putative transposase
MSVTTRFRYRFYPSDEQELLLRKTIGCARYVFNRGLRLRQDMWAKGNSINYEDTAAALTAWKKEPDGHPSASSEQSSPDIAGKE